MVFRLRYIALFLPFFILCLAPAYAQQWTYRADNSIKVYNEHGQLMNMAWCGGANTPQFAMADLDNDGIRDLVIFEQGIGLRTFINNGVPGKPVYVYTPSFEANFPVVNEYLKLVDYNNDGVSDLVHRGRTGFSIYRGYFENNRLKFSFYKDLLYRTITGQIINAYCEPDDIPAVEDVDGDGDLDFFSYYIGGGYISYYKNCQVEEGLPADSIKICLSDNCWGKVYQSYERNQALATVCSSFGVSCKGCPQPQQKTTHAGNTLCLLDYDGDGDYDYFNGNNAFPDIQFLRNGKKNYSYPIDTMIAQDTVWGTDGRALTGKQWPAAYWLDIDSDGDKDLLFAPHARGAENYRSIVLYENTGTVSSPAYTYRSDTFLMDQVIDLGIGSYPMLYDYNKDGRPDLFVGSQGYYQQDGSFRSRIAYYENTSSGSDIAFTLRTRDFLNIGSLNITGAVPAAGDLDGDGKDDLVIGRQDGTLLYFSNKAASGDDRPDWQLIGDLRDGSGQLIELSGHAAPFIYDMDKDGSNDLLIGSRSGSVTYYRGSRNSTGSPNLTFVTDELGGARSAPAMNMYGFSVPFVGKVDNSGKDYLLLGSQSGAVYRYDGFQNGAITTPFVRLDSNYAGIVVPPMSALTAADLDGDGRYELFAGNTAGGIKLYRQGLYTDDDTPRTAEPKVTLYPNPAQGSFTIMWTPAFRNGDVSVVLFSVTGQEVLRYDHNITDQFLKLDVSHLASGIYYCRIISGNNREVKPVSVLR